MLRQLTVTLDTSDPLQAQLLVEYLAAEDRARFGRSCLLLGYLAATRDMGPVPLGVPLSGAASADTAQSRSGAAAWAEQPSAVLSAGHAAKTSSGASAMDGQGMNASSEALSSGATSSTGPAAEKPVKGSKKPSTKRVVGAGLFGG